ncbi:hypothetical protein BIW11_12210 [Tropilaelaps mercedesae]|uniref:Lysosomal acid phosphatase-like n=1 Tax=Tropilaelaps mercedesae TaxID=418985 RepID=A0A1V9X7J1_9ACAR|nr:hypothetical protein BIW11_12210 [Tropilaelaps mercedesae]
MNSSKVRWFRLAVDVLLGVIAVACLAALFTIKLSQHEILSFGQAHERAELRHVVVLAQHGESYPIIPLPGFEYELGVHTLAGQEQVHQLGQRLREEYEHFTESLSAVRWVSTDDARNLETSEVLLAELQLNATSFSILPPIFNSGIDEFYVHLTPILDSLREKIPFCIRVLAEQDVADAPSDVVTFWSYLISDSLDSLSTSVTDIPSRLNISDDCASPDRPLVSPEMFLNVTVSCMPLFMPVINTVLLEMLAAANDGFGAAKWIKASENNGHCLSIYGITDFHIELITLCLRTDDAVMTRPGNGAHMIFELGDDNIMKLVFERSEATFRIQAKHQQIFSNKKVKTNSSNGRQITVKRLDCINF